MRMLSLAADTVGTHVPDNLTGSIFSVHDHVVNIKDDGGYRLVSIVDRPGDLTALAVLVARLPDGAEPGQAVGCAKGCITVAGAGDGFQIGPVAASRRFDGKIAGLKSTAGRRALCTLLPEIRAAVLAHGKPGGLRELLREASAGESGKRPPRSPFEARAKSILNAAAGLNGLAKLVGLGPGFTPSGDDFIAGFLAGCAAAGVHPANGPGGSGSPVRPGLEFVGVRERLGATTIGGATLLELALCGSFPAYLCDFAARVGRICLPETGASSVGSAPESPSEPPSRAVVTAVVRASRHGETSGTDALTGFIRALQLICEGGQLDELAD